MTCHFWAHLSSFGDHGLLGWRSCSLPISWEGRVRGAVLPCGPGEKAELPEPAQPWEGNTLQPPGATVFGASKRANSRTRGLLTFRLSSTFRLWLQPFKSPSDQVPHLPSRRLHDTQLSLRQYPPLRLNLLCFWLIVSAPAPCSSRELTAPSGLSSASGPL